MNLVRRFVRYVVREAVKELTEHPIKLDVSSLLSDISSPKANADLQRFFTGNHRFIALLAEKNRRAAVDTYDYVDQSMHDAVFCRDQMEVIASKREQIMQLGGHILDLGVYKGSSTRRLASIFPHETIHGFDSFEGLPGDWSHALKGTFGEVRGALPDMPANVKLYKGWFEDTLPAWLEGHRAKPISLLRVDCDIYSSTKTIFDVLRPLVRSGTWIVFDELIGYRGFRDNELKAFNEFIDGTGFDYHFVAHGLTYAILYLK